MEKTPLCAGASNSLREASAHMVYDAINQRVSQLISSVTKSRSGHEFSRAYVQKYQTPASARARARERENFWFQFSGLWPYCSLSLSSGNGDISREEAREEEKEARLLDGFCDSSHFHERSAEFIIGVTSPAHFVRASSSPLIYTSELSLLQISDFSTAEPEMSLLDRNLIRITSRES